MEPERFHYAISTIRSIKRALDVLGEKWTLLVLREAIYGVRRFDDFARALKCGRAVLSARLKTLTDAGILKRVEYREGDQRARAEYHLDEKGVDLFTTIQALSQWGETLDASARWPRRQGDRSGLGAAREGGFDQRPKGQITLIARTQDCARVPERSD
jgi:DNA-binding HxlR family transcriptional regulator